MNSTFVAMRLLAAAAATIAAAAAPAQTPITYKAHCHSIGGSGAQEAIGDREGHALSVTEATCRIEGGPFDGAVFTNHAIYEWDRTNATGVSAHGVIRRPDAMSIYQIADFKLALTLADGKVTGFTGSGRGVYKLAAGAAASLHGKTFSYTVRSTGARQSLVETKVD